MALEVKIKGNKIFAPLKGKDLILTPEEIVRQEFLVHLVNTYGYSLDQMALKGRKLRLLYLVR